MADTQSKNFKKRHPDSSYEAKYPYNRVELTESGHEIHYDDTPGKERMRWSHKSGTYTEISPDGRQVQMVVGHAVSYAKGGFTQTTDKNSDVKTGGSTRTNTSGSSHTEVKGSQSSAVSGDSKSVVGGDSVSAVKGDSVSGVTGAMVMKLGGGVQFKSDGKDGASKPVEGKIDDKLDIEVAKDVRVMSKTKITFECGSSTITMTPDKIVIDTPRLDLEKDAASNVEGKDLELSEKVFIKAALTDTN